MDQAAGIRCGFLKPMPTPPVLRKFEVDLPPAEIPLSEVPKLAEAITQSA